MAVRIPLTLASNCRKTAERTSWLRELPREIGNLERRWSLTLDTQFGNEGASCAWVAPVTRADGTSAILKLAMPHFEGEHEMLGLRFWDGDPTVRLLEADNDLGAMLLERCQPGTPLGVLPEPEQDVIIAGLLKRLWRSPAEPHPFRPLSAMLDYWTAESLADEAKWPDIGLVREGLLLFKELADSAPAEVLLATDLHAGNVLRSEREPWLIIDPKPFVGDPAYDVTQHLFNCERLLQDPNGTIDRVADLLRLDRRRVRLWTFARAAAEPREDWNGTSITLARAIAPA
jgi:streptomycin 6-kinase